MGDGGEGGVYLKLDVQDEGGGRISDEDGQGVWGVLKFFFLVITRVRQFSSNSKND